MATGVTVTQQKFKKRQLFYWLIFSLAVALSTYLYVVTTVPRIAQAFPISRWSWDWQTLLVILAFNFPLVLILLLARIVSKRIFSNATPWPPPH